MGCLQIMYLALACLIFCAISCGMSGTGTASAAQFFQYWFILYELVLAITFLGMLIAVSVPFPPVSQGRPLLALQQSSPYLGPIPRPQG